MFDFRLKVFHVVAKRLSFTKAAEELFITQPAVSKHIQEIESFYKTRLFKREGSKIKLTPAGHILLKHTEELHEIYRMIDVELAALHQNQKGMLRIGASTTVSQYFLPQYLATFKQKYPDVTISLTSHNTEFIENLLEENKIDLGIVEGQSKRKYIKYTPFVKDEIVLCTANSKNAKSTLTTNELQKLPLVFREPGSGSLDVILSALKQAGVDVSKLTVEIELESTESIKSYLLHTHSFAFLSFHSIFKELKVGELKVVDVKGLDIIRYFSFITHQGDAKPLVELFMKHILSHNFKL